MRTRHDARFCPPSRGAPFLVILKGGMAFGLGNPMNDKDQREAMESGPGDRLDSWKEIAAYLKRDERTVRRWEKFGLPVHRHVNNRKAAVYAYRAELDAWWAKDRTRAEAAPNSSAARLDGLRLTGVALAALSFALIAWWSFWGREAQSSSVLLTPVPSLVNHASNLAFSPSGEQLAFAWEGEAGSHLDIYVKGIGNAPLVRLTSDAADHCCAAWSPDGQRIAFVRHTGAEPGIFAIPASGGAEQKLLPLRADRYFDLAWTDNGKSLVFAERPSDKEPSRIFRYSLETGEKVALTNPPAGSSGDARFAVSPDGTSLAFIRQQSPPGSIILVMPLSGGAPSSVLGESSWIGHLAWTVSGRDLIFSSDRRGGSKLWRVPAAGGEPRLLSLAGENAWFPTTSPTGNRLAFVQERQTANLAEIELGDSPEPVRRSRPIAPTTREDWSPRYSPDGGMLAFHSNRSSTYQIWVSGADGSQPVPITAYTEGNTAWPSWSPDGSQIAFSHKGELRVISSRGGASRTLVNHEYTQGPVWSRDGQWIYYYSQGAKSGQVWKIPAQGGSPVQLTRNGGLFVAESADGQWIYYSKAAEAGIWRMPAAGGEETLVLDGLEPAHGGYWTVVADGIYWLNQGNAKELEIEFYNFAQRRSRRVAAFPGTAAIWGGGMTVSPDGKRMIVAQVLLHGTDVMLAENFR